MKLEKKSRILYAVAIGLLIFLYFLPIWRIDLKAPQYPEGIGLYILIDDIIGQERNNLLSVNRLNKYIGMKPIVPEEIPELTLMPFILGAVIVIGVICWFTGKRNYLIGWILLLAVVGIAGLADFYIWAYDYGTNLDPQAPIKIPGMTYIPPLIGTKQLLNITASSYPASGGIIAGISGLLAIVALYIDIQLRKMKRSQQ